MSFRTLLAALTVAVFAGSAFAQGYPAKPIHIISPYAVGGSVSLVARLLGDKLSASLGQPVIIENKPGASTAIGTEYVMRSAPAGYTLLMTAMTMVLYPHFIPSQLDVTRDLVAVTTVSAADLILVAHPSLPANTLQEVLALAKSKPGQLNYASPALGGLTHVGRGQAGRRSGQDRRHS